MNPPPSPSPPSRPANERESAAPGAPAPRDRLTAALDELVQLKYHVSHDLNAPLASARGLLELIREDLHDGRHDEIEEMVDETVAQIVRVEALIADLMSLARAGAPDEPPERVDLRGLVDDIVAGISLHSRELEVSVTLRFDAPSLVTDRVRLRQILANLIVNARKFRDPCEVAPSIDVGVTRNAASHVVTVADNGIGMSDEVAARAFGMFERGSAAHAGHGLGLHIVCKHVEHLGGTVRIARTGKPTVIEVVLPTHRPGSGGGPG